MRLQESGNHDEQRVAADAAAVHLHSNSDTVA
jgi:hypothetical protein